eukprot:gene7924-12392_t
MKTSQDTQNYIQEQYSFQKRKLQLDYMEKLMACQMDHKDDAFMYHESREIADKWFEDESKKLDAKFMFKEKSEKLSDSITTAGNKLYEQVEPFVDMAKQNIEEGLEDLSSSDLQTFWNHEARDVQYLENNWNHSNQRNVKIFQITIIQ